MKRAFDIIASIAALAILAPVMLVTAAAVWLKFRRPVIFKQERPGLYAAPFHILKFRSMVETSDADGQPLSDERRLTAFGRFLRSTSLDELPELFNVLRGDMSLVGPRPLLTQYLGRYTSEQARRHEVKPGITGWAQVHGRNELSWQDKFRLDVWYVDHRSLGLDCLILCMTVRALLTRRGITQAGHATTEEFKGEIAT